MNRKAPFDLEEQYKAQVAAPTDIHEHLATLRAYAGLVTHVTEIGVRGGCSTTALLAAQPDVLVSYDIDPAAIVNPYVAELLQNRGRTTFQPRVADSLAITIEPTDMLFIDSLHTYSQLWAELDLHSDFVSRFLAFHDTVTFGLDGEDKSGRGLRHAIDDWRNLEWSIKKNYWSVVHDAKNNNGLLVLELRERHYENDLPKSVKATQGVRARHRKNAHPEEKTQ